jgi:hypothetical protein
MPTSSKSEQLSAHQVPRDLPMPRYGYQKEDNRSFNVPAKSVQTPEEQGQLDLSLVKINLKL